MRLASTLQKLAKGQWRQVFDMKSDGAAFFGSAMKMSAVRAVIIVLSFVGSVALTRSIGPEGRGLIAWFIAAASIAMTFAQCGVEVLNRRYTAEDPKLAGGLAVLTLQACLVGTLVTAPFLLYFALSSSVGSGHLAMLIVAIISVFFMAAAPCLNSLQMGLNNIRDFMWGVAFQKIGNLILVLGLIWMGLISPLTGMLALLVSYMLQVGMALYSLRKDIARRQPGALAFTLSKKEYMFHNFVRNILQMSTAAVIPLLLGSQHSLASAGWFAACMIIIDAINKTFGMMITYALPQIAGSKGAAAKKRLARNVQLMSFWGMLAIAVVWAAIAGWAIPLLLGHEFVAAVLTFRILCVYMVLTSLADANLTIVMAGTEKGLIVLAPVATLISAALSAWLLIPTYGANGGAMALVISAAVSALVSWICIRKVGLHYDKGLPSKREELDEPEAI